MINNRIENTFLNLKKSKKKALITFVTGCDPDYNTSQKILKELVKQGSDLLEIGMPFSDPMADGPIIQKSSLRALSAGTNMKKIFRLVSDFRKKNKVIPIVLMGYLNPILSFGIKNFFKSAKNAGTDGLIVVDVPPEEDDEIFNAAKENNIDLIKLATPTTMPSQPLSAITAASFGPLIPKPTATGIFVFFLIFLTESFTTFGSADFAPVIPFMDT